MTKIPALAQRTGAKTSFSTSQLRTRQTAAAQTQQSGRLEKIRVGSAADGGYIQLNDFTNITHAISLGISTDDNWDISLALRGIPVDQFDHSILEAPTNHRLLSFSRKRISVYRSAETATLEDIVAPYFRPGLPDLILKMDIEGDEWDVLDKTSAETLRTERQRKTDTS